VPEAAELLGVTVDAVRGRIRRGTLDSERESGTVYVWVDRSELDRRDQSQTVERPSSDQSELVEALREQIAYLQGVIATRDQELAQRAEEIRRRDLALEREQQLAAMFADRLRELEAPRGTPSGTRESPESAGPIRTPTEAPGSAHGTTERPEGQEPQGGEESRSIWRRIFGG
jgi:TolA-binding protein